MALPSATAGPSQVDVYGSLPRLTTLTGSGSPGPILEYEWTMLSVASGSTANVGVDGDFTDGIASIASPSFTCDKPGAYVLQLRVRNSIGWSVPDTDVGNAQTIIFIKTEKLSLYVPGVYEFDYGLYLNETISKLEDAAYNIKETAGPTELTPGAITDGQILKRSGSSVVGITLTQDDILPAFLPTASVSPSSLEIGNSSNAIISVSYNRSAAAATVAVDGGAAVSLTTPFTGITLTGPFSKSTPNYYYTFTITANETGGASKTSNTYMVFYPYVIYGEAVPGTYDGTWILALGATKYKGLRSSKAWSGLSFNTGAGEYEYYCLPSSYGTPSFLDAGTGFDAAYSKVASSVSVTNTYAVTITYDVWRSNNPYLGSRTINVS